MIPKQNKNKTKIKHQNIYMILNKLRDKFKSNSIFKKLIY